MRQKVIIGNWKMNKNPKEAKAFCKGFVSFAHEALNHNVLVGVASTYLCLDSIKSYSNDMIISAENCHYEDKGAFTGEVSALMLKELGIKYCLIGHSERRKYDHETNKKCNLKIHKLLSLDMVPVYCVGESLKQYEEGKSKDVVKKQILEGLKNVDKKAFEQLVIAYEPVWSIGTGKNASKEIAEDICGFIRGLIKENFGPKAASSVRIQYGGSVKPENAKEYLKQKDIDGVLVGGASLKIESFIDLASKAF